MSGRFVDRIFPVHRYAGNGITHEIDVKVFGAGFVQLISWRDDRNTNESATKIILLDSGDIERLEEALKEAKRRRNGHMRRIRRKIDREYAIGKRSYASST